MRIDKNKFHVTNGVIDSVSLRMDRDMWLSLWIVIRHEGGGNQEFGGYVLGGSPDCAAGRHENQKNIAGDYIVRCLAAVGVKDLNDMPGKAIRVLRNTQNYNASIVGIGHIIDDDKWFVAEDRMELLTSGVK